MATPIVWDGLKEYLDELRRLPDESKAEAAKLIQGGVNAAYVTIARVYDAHRHTGTLRARLRISTLRGGLKLTSGSPIAWLFDNGSQARHYVEASGATHATGRMWGRTPPTHIFARTVAKERRTLTEQYKAMLRRRGAATVTSDE